jgi:hypothetical protein
MGIELQHGDDVIFTTGAETPLDVRVNCDDNLGSSVVPTPPVSGGDASLTIFHYDYLVAHLNQMLCVIVSFGVVFPPLAILGSIALIVRCVFIQCTLCRFVLVLDAAGEISAQYCKTLQNSCDMFHLPARKHLSTSFAVSFAILSFFLFV